MKCQKGNKKAAIIQQNNIHLVKCTLIGRCHLFYMIGILLEIHNLKE